MSGRNNYDGSPPPCDSCERRKLCATQLLACKCYKSWVSPVDSLPSMERIPSHDIFRQMHGMPAINVERDAGGLQRVSA